MNRATRFVVFGLGAAGLAALFALALFGMPDFGGHHHPYRDLAVSAGVSHVTPNVVSSVNFDQRPLDTLGEEMILFGSVVGATVLLRPSRKEAERPPPSGGRILDSTALLCWALLPVTVMIGLDVVIHGHLTPGGGFQGGVVLATGLHLLYLAGRYPALRRLRPMRWYEWGEGFGAVAFAGLGVAGLAIGGAFLRNIVPFGSFRQLLSAGTVPMFNVAVGCEVACGAVVLLAQFLTQAIQISGQSNSGQQSR